MFDKLRNYVINNDLEIHFINNKINIVNYDEIILMEQDRISIIKNNIIVVIKGNNLSLSKLLDKELLITGNIKLISWSD